MDYYEITDEGMREKEDAGRNNHIEEDYYYTAAWFSWNGSIYAVQWKNETNSETESQDIEGGFVKRLKLEDGKAVLEDTTDIPQLDWTEMVQDYGEEYQDSKSLDDAAVCGDNLIGRSWGMNGEGMLEVFELATGFHREMEISDSASIYIGSDSILTCEEDYEDNSCTYNIQVVDPENGSQKELLSYTLEGDENYMYNMVFNAEKNTLYYIMNGEIWAMPDLQPEAAIPVCDCPTIGNMFFLPDGRMLIWDSNNIIIRNIDPAARGSETRMIVNAYGYGDGLEEAIYDFTNAHGDVTVVLKRGGDRQTILQDMMNRESETDIYTMDYDWSEFSALLNRGFLTDISGNAKIAADNAALYPFVRDALVKDGQVVAVPLGISGGAISIDRKAWKEIGGTEEELPKTWGQFIDWLETLPEKVKDQNIGIFEPYTSDYQVIRQVMRQILTEYEAKLENAGREFAFNTPELRELLERVQKMDAEALGLKEQADMEEGYYDYDDDYKEPLIQIYNQSTMQTYGGSSYSPLLLSFEENEQPILPISLTVAFINPYSTKAELAAEYLAIAGRKLWQDALYSLYSDVTEPVISPYYEENHARSLKELEDIKTLLNAAKTEQEIHDWTESLKSYEEMLENEEEYKWIISPENIADYEGRTPYLKIAAYSFVNDMVKDEKSGEAFWSMVEGFARGEVSAAELLESIDSKVQMMRLEGN
jgi:ABC-type glycerol-3-phosphate transport system substrate-binding protein